MSSKKIMIIGSLGSGKSELANLINGTNRPLKKSQDVIYGVKTIDVPTSYIENRWMIRHIIAIAQNHASVILLLVNENTPNIFYSHGFAKLFNCPVFGVMTGNLDEGAKRNCEDELERAGVLKPYYYLKDEKEYRQLFVELDK